MAATRAHIAALDLLAAKRSTKFVAHTMGFANAAAYVAAFHAVLGGTPGMFRGDGAAAEMASLP